MNKEEKYIIGENYEGLGKYIGIKKVYPWGTDYAYNEHQFTEGIICTNEVAKINTIFIEKVKR